MARPHARARGAAAARRAPASGLPGDVDRQRGCGAGRGAGGGGGRRRRWFWAPRRRRRRRALRLSLCRFSAAVYSTPASPTKGSFSPRPRLAALLCPLCLSGWL